MRQFSIWTLCGAMATLVACNSGSGSSSTTNNTNAQYANIESIVQLKFNSLPAAMYGLKYNSPLATGLLTAVAGNYLNVTNIESPALYQQANIKSTVSDYHFNPITNFIARYFNSSAYSVESVAAYAIRYTTPGQNAKTDPSQTIRTASGLIIVPNMKTGQTIKGVVIYFHPTSFGKNQVPSCPSAPANDLPAIVNNLPSYCNLTALDNTGAGYFLSLSGVFANNGYIVVAPDYLGQGVDYANIHPYVAYPDVNVLSAFNMLPALRQILATNYNITQNQKLNLFITGYSEGGGYALRASQLAQGQFANFMQNNNLSLRITSPQEGAYSLTDQMNFAFADNNDGLFNCSNNPSYKCGQTSMFGTNDELSAEVKQMNQWKIVSSAYAAQTKPILTAYVLTAAMYYSFHNLSGAYDFAMDTSFWSFNLNGINTNLYQLFAADLGAKLTGSEIASALINNTYTVNNYSTPTTPNLTLYAGLNSLMLLTLPSTRYGNYIAGSLFMNKGINTNPQFIQILSNASTYNWHTNSPINFIHMNYDSAVSVINSAQAYSCMKYGKSFAGDDQLIASTASCNVGGSNLVESTPIANFQLTNNLAQLKLANPLAQNKFWTKDVLTQQATNGQPYDHGDMFVLGNIIALCSFENITQNDTNSGVCPAQYAR